MRLRALSALLLHAALTLWLTWPLARHAATHLPDTLPMIGRFDTVYAAWVMAWETHALGTAPTRLLDTNIYHPTPKTLFYGPTAFGTLPYFAPVFAATGNPALAFNMALLACFTLTAFAIHRVVVRWTRSELAGAVAGAAFLLDRWVLWMIPNLPHYVALQYFPVLIWAAALPTLAPGTALVLALAIALQCATDPVYIAPAVMLPLGLLAFLRLVRPSTRREGLRLIGVLALAALALAPIYAGYLAVRLNNPQLDRQTMWPQQVGLLPAERSQHLPWALLGAFTALPSAALALVPLALAVVAGRRLLGGRWETRRAWGQAAFWVAMGLVLSVTPIVIWGRHVIHLPHHALATHLPIYRFIRMPVRLRAGAMIGLALLVGLAFAECLRALDGVRAAWLRRTAAVLLALVVVLGMYAEYRRGGPNPAFIPVPPTYPVAPAITADGAVVQALRAGSGPVVEVPSFGGSPLENVRAMYRSVFHWRPLLNGYSSYWPAGFPERMALADRLPDALALAALRAETGLAAVVVNLDAEWSERAAWLALAAAGGNDVLRLVARDGNQLLFAVRAAEATSRNGTAPVPVDAERS